MLQNCPCLVDIPFEMFQSLLAVILITVIRSDYLIPIVVLMLIFTRIVSLWNHSPAATVLSDNLQRLFSRLTIYIFHRHY